MQTYDQKNLDKEEITNSQKEVAEIPNLIFDTTENTKNLDKKYTPKEVHVGEYFIPNALNHGESEDIAARIIRQSQKEGKFIAPTYKSLGEQIIAQLKLEDEISKKRQAKHEQVPTKTIMKKFKDGFKKLLGNKVEVTQQADVEIKDTKDPSVPFSILAFQCRFNPSSFPVEVKRMIDQGYLTLLQKDNEDYLEPTEKLIDQILKVQKIKESR